MLLSLVLAGWGRAALQAFSVMTTYNYECEKQRRAHALGRNPKPEGQSVTVPRSKLGVAPRQNYTSKVSTKSQTAPPPLYWRVRQKRHGLKPETMDSTCFLCPFLFSIFLFCPMALPPG